MRAFIAGRLPEPFGRGDPGAEAAPRPKPFTEHGAAHLLEGIAHDVAVDAEAWAHVLLEEGAEIGQAVAQIALGRRTKAHERSRGAEKARLLAGQVRGVHGDELLAE